MAILSALLSINKSCCRGNITPQNIPTASPELVPAIAPPSEISATAVRLAGAGEKATGRFLVSFRRAPRGGRLANSEREEEDPAGRGSGSRVNF